MIICSKCGKENEDRYKFCLGCGAQLSGPPPADPGARPAAATPSSSSAAPVAAPPAGAAKGSPLAEAVRQRAVAPTPPAGVAKVHGPSLSPSGQLAAALLPTQPERDARDADALSSGEAPMVRSRPAPAATVACPGCGASNPSDFLFCGSCGARLKDVPQQTASLRSAAAPAPAAAAGPSGKLALIRPDGSEGGSHPLRDTKTVVGRGAGPLLDSDSYLSPQHASFTFANGRLLVEDIGSLNGVFVRITREHRLNDGDIFRVGQELLRFDVIKQAERLEDGTEIMGSPNPGYWGRLSIIVGPSVTGSAFPLIGDEVVLGRERGDILFSDDGYVSGTHAKVSLRDGMCCLTDLGSSNGTFVRLTQATEIPSGTFVLMGQQLFRVDYRAA